jgi:hypothetical protein
MIYLNWRMANGKCIGSLNYNLTIIYMFIIVKYNIMVSKILVQ